MTDLSVNNYNIPRESYIRIFLRFLKFGLLAWGGPVAQIAMIRQELVEDEKWIPPERFNRALAVYQVLPGPEAHELCVYFGMLAGGRIGAFLAGLGFMLPGFALMFLLSWFYVTVGISSPLFQAVFLGMQPAVAALVVRAAHRIGGHALHDHRWLWGIALGAALAQLLGVNFLIILLAAGIIYALWEIKLTKAAFGVSALFAVGLALTAFGVLPLPGLQSGITAQASTGSPSVMQLLFYGLRAGLLTFGGAYTVIPFLQHDAVNVGGWMTNAQFLDGIALSGLLPAPLIIFSTFVGYIGAGAWGAIAMTLGIFAPAFLFTMVGHDYLERLVEKKSAHAFLDGVTSGVVGLIGATALGILNQTIIGIQAWAIFALALVILFRSSAKWTVVAIVLGAGLYGILFLQ
ncbi:MAG: chromate efflux transporter [Chloroflexi bacterium]|nr:chromate efflux transporter [Chloroflexota bacterium]